MKKCVAQWNVDQLYNEFTYMHVCAFGPRLNSAQFVIHSTLRPLLPLSICVFIYSHLFDQSSDQSHFHFALSSVRRSFD